MAKKYTIVNGPMLGQTLSILYGSSVRCFHMGEFINYEKCGDSIPETLGPLLMIEGTQYVFSDGADLVLFAHPDYQLSALSIVDGKIHPCEVAPPVTSH